MALGSFGIKEVADVRFYPAGSLKVENGAIAYVETEQDKQPNAVLEFTTLKVSNLEFTAEQSEARGGKGNAPLIIWDYGREVNITLEDALMSVECMKKVFGSTATDGIVIGAKTFPDNYAIVGTTFARSQADGEDHLFTFFVPNAKMGSEVTLTMEAEGDPTVFSMNMRALRASSTDDTMVALLPDENIWDGKTDVFGTVLKGIATE